MFSAKHQQDFGKQGEDFAEKYLRKLGYSFLYRNFKIGRLEIDLILRDPFGTLAFVEVKSMHVNAQGITPEDHMDPKKVNRIKAAGQMFVAKHPELIRGGSGWRVDALTLTFNEKDCEINHYQNI